MSKTMPRRGRRWGPVVLVCLAHLIIVQQFFPLGAVWSDAPMGGDDFDTHVGQTYRLIRALSENGEHWGYSPHLLAGFPAGAIFDADNKGWSYFTYALSAWFDVKPAHAFNLYAYLTHVLVPVIAMGAAVLFGFSRSVAVVFAGMCSLYWYFDSWSHWCFWVGMVSYSFASYFALLPLGLFHRFLSSKKMLYGVLCAPALGVAHLIHPYSFFILVLPMVVLYAVQFRSLTRQSHCVVVAIGATTLLINAPWLAASLRHWHHILDSAYFAQGGVQVLLTDVLNLLNNPTDTGAIGTRTALRFVYALLAGGAILSWGRTRDIRLYSLGVAVPVLFFFTYLGGYVPGLGQIQPYRHALPAGFFAALPAAYLVVEAWRTGLPASATPAVRVVCAGLLLLSGQKILDEVRYFVPHRLPPVQKLIDGRSSLIDPSGHRPWMAYTLPNNGGSHTGVDDLVRWVRQNVGSHGRIVADEMVLGERLAWREATEVIGGFRLRNLEHSMANIMRTHQDRVIPEKMLKRYVETYSVTHFIVLIEHPEFARMPELLEPLGLIFGRQIYRVKNPIPKLRGSQGEVQASFNRISIRGSDPAADLVLSYHYHPTLRCEPDCDVMRLAVPWNDPVGFMQVRAPHPVDFDLVNRY